MNKTAVLQIPMEKSLRVKSEEGAREMGFTSLQDLVRLFLSKVAASTMSVNFCEIPEITLSKKAIRRYNRQLKKIESGKGFYKLENAEDLFSPSARK